MNRDSYYEVEAESRYHLGNKLGERFASTIHRELRKLKKKHHIQDAWYQSFYERAIERARREIPDVAEELEGYADGAEITLNEMWWLAMGYDINSIRHRHHGEGNGGNHCTTVITNNGLLVGHNEDDWPSTAEDLYVVKKMIPGRSILELYYAGGVGGNSISINSNGFIQAVNSLPDSKYREGLPCDLIARWLSETGNPEDDHQIMEQMTRMSGYSHNLVSYRGDVYNIESCAKKSVLTELADLDLPFCHTNHFLQDIPECPTDEDDEDVIASKNRYNKACELVKDHMTVKEMRKLLSNDAGEDDNAIFNEGTIGRMIVDLELIEAHIWLYRDSKSGWTTFDLRFMG